MVPILAFTGFCAIMLVLAVKLLAWPWSNIHLVSLGFFCFLTLVLHYWQEGSTSVTPKGLAQRFMLGLVIKMGLSLVLVGCILLFAKNPVRVQAVLSFVFLYLAFLSFSTVRLVNLRR